MSRKLWIPMSVLVMLLLPARVFGVAAAAKSAQGAQQSGNDAGSQCAAPVFTFSKLDTKDGKSAVLNIKTADFETNLDVAIWSGLKALPPPGDCFDALFDATLQDSPKSPVCGEGRQRVFLATAVTGASKTTEAGEDSKAGEDKDNGEPQKTADNGKPKKTTNKGGPLKTTKAGEEKDVYFNPHFDPKELYRDPQVLVVYRLHHSDDYKACTPKAETGTPAGTVAALMDLHTVEIDAGAVTVMQANGSWKSQPEAALLATGRWSPRLTTYTDLRYSYVGAVSSNSSQNNQQPQQQRAAAGPTKAASGGSDSGGGTGDNSSNDNPFKSGGGTFRGNFYFAWSLDKDPSRIDAISLISGLGFTTVPDTANFHAPVRGFAGLRFDFLQSTSTKPATDFGGTFGYLQAGYAYDNFWSYDKTAASTVGEPGIPGQRHRIFIEGQLRLPNNTTIAASPRLFVDLPASGGGQADVRLSLLAQIDTSKLATWIKGVTGGK